MASKKSRKRKNNNQDNNLEKLKIAALRGLNQVGKAVNHKQLAAHLGIKEHFKKMLLATVLDELAQKNKIERMGRGQYQAKGFQGEVTGKIDGTRRGSGYLVSEQLEEDAFIYEDDMGKAFHGDTVRAKVQKRGRKKLVAQVIEVVERFNQEYTGTLEVSENFSFFIPQNDKITVDFFMPGDKLKGGKNGEKVLVKLVDWPDKAKSPLGEVIKVLGKPGEIEAETQGILADYGLATEFPKHVERAADKISLDIADEEIAKRRDMREVTTFTIDPVDAKDFDDALSLEKLENGNWEIGVHIADVSHYIKPGDLIDKEALERATSIYLVDRVIPMLPEKLSNGVCSLRPKEDKLTYACIFEIDDDAQILKTWVGRTVIHSDRRFIYDEVQEMIEGADGDFKEECLTLDTLAKKFRAKRVKNGSIEFDRAEVRLDLDEDKKPKGVRIKIQKDAHKLIEEFMLLANKAVAQRFGKTTEDNKGKTFIYRTHDNPDPEKLVDFARFAKEFGHKLDFNTPEKVAKSLNTMLKKVKGKPEENLLSQLAIRTMAKAEYSTENIGHYGLGFPFYSHFTSPIRRYPDVIAHRLITQYLDGGKSADQEMIEHWAKHSSDMERRAVMAERESTKLFQMIFMQEKVGKEFEGTVSGITEWGIYVEIGETLAEGMIRYRDMQGDYYHYDEKGKAAVGHNQKNKIVFGDKLSVRVEKVDLLNRRMDLSMSI